LGSIAIMSRAVSRSSCLAEVSANATGDPDGVVIKCSRRHHKQRECDAQCAVARVSSSAFTDLPDGVVASGSRAPPGATIRVPGFEDLLDVTLVETVDPATPSLRACGITEQWPAGKELPTVNLTSDLHQRFKLDRAVRRLDGEHPQCPHQRVHAIHSCRERRMERQAPQGTRQCRRDAIALGAPT